MVKYDSASKKLTLLKQYVISGDTSVSIHGEVDLSRLSNLEQQRVIAIAKLTVQFANGHDIKSRRTTKAKDGSQTIVDSQVGEAQRIINLVPKVIKLEGQTDTKEQNS